MRHLFRAFIPASIIGLALSEFTLIFLCCLGGSWLVGRLLNPYLDIHDEGGLIRICLVIACLALGLYFQNLYTDVRVKSIALLVQQTWR